MLHCNRSRTNSILSNKMIKVPTQQIKPIRIPDMVPNKQNEELLENKPD